VFVSRAGRPAIVVLEQAGARVTGRTPFVVGRRVQRCRVVPKALDAPLGLVGGAAKVRVVHGEVVVGAVVDAQRHAVELHAVVVDHQPLLVRRQMVVADGRALDGVRVLVHGAVVRGALQRARDVGPGQVPDEAAHVVGHLHLVRERQLRFVDERVDGGQPRTVRADVHHQQLRPPRHVHARLPFQRPAARRSLRAFRTRPRFRAVCRVVVHFTALERTRVRCAFQHLQ